MYPPYVETVGLIVVFDFTVEFGDQGFWAFQLNLDLCGFFFFFFLRTMFVLTILKDKQLQFCPWGNKDGRLFGISVRRSIRLFIFLTTGSSSSTPFSTPRQPLPPPLSLPPFSGTQPTYRSPQTSRRQVGSSIIQNKLSEFWFGAHRIV